MRFLFAVLIAASSAMAAGLPLPQNTLFTINRVNFKPNKTLVYEALLQSQKCELDANLLKAFYIIDEGGGTYSNEVMSADSQKYFGPQVDEASVTTTAFDFTFEALKMATSIPEVDRRVMVDLVSTPSKACDTVATIKLSGVVYRMRGIRLALSKVFGIPTGVDWVIVDLEDLTSGQKSKACIIGTCPN